MAREQTPQRDSQLPGGLGENVSEVLVESTSGCLDKLIPRPGLADQPSMRVEQLNVANLKMATPTIRSIFCLTSIMPSGGLPIVSDRSYQ